MRLDVREVGLWDVALVEAPGIEEEKDVGCMSDGLFRYYVYVHVVLLLVLNSSKI